eukprot:201719-Rhodomonas_salina.4
MVLYACYAVPNTDPAYCTVSLVLRKRMVLYACYAVSGTELAYGATRPAGTAAPCGFSRAGASRDLYMHMHA